MPVEPSLAALIESALAAEPAVLDAYVFGSVARGEARAGSDIDVAVFLDPAAAVPLPWGWAASINTRLVEALGRNDVDVAILNRATPLLYHRVLRDGSLVVSRDRVATSERELQARSRWLDWQACRARAA